MTFYPRLKPLTFKQKIKNFIENVKYRIRHIFKQRNIKILYSKNYWIYIPTPMIKRAMPSQIGLEIYGTQPLDKPIADLAMKRIFKLIRVARGD